MSQRDIKEGVFIELRIRGKTFEEISKELAVSKQTLINWNKIEVIKDAIRAGKQIRVESILREYQLDRESRLQNLSLISRRINQEIEKREYSEISTERLFKIAILNEIRIKQTIKVETFTSPNEHITPLDIDCVFKFDPFD